MSAGRLDRLAGELRRWSRRPTRLSPPAARTRVLAGLPDRRPRPRWGLVAAGATLAAAALAVALIVDRPSPPAGRPAAPEADRAQQIIVHQLSSGTRLYIVVRPEIFDD